MATISTTKEKSLPFFPNKKSRAPDTRKMLVTAYADKIDDPVIQKINLSNLISWINQKLKEEELELSYAPKSNIPSAGWTKPKVRIQDVTERYYDPIFPYLFLDSVRAQITNEIKNGSADVALIFSDICILGSGRTLPLGLNIVENDQGEQWNDFVKDSVSIKGRGIILIGTRNAGICDELELTQRIQELPYVLLHELGHTWGLNHSKSGIMNSIIHPKDSQFDEASKNKILQILARQKYKSQ